MKVDEKREKKKNLMFGVGGCIFNFFILKKKLESVRKILVEYLSAWGFYPLHKSVYLHAYPCLKEMDFLREYLGVGKYVRMFTVSEIENDTQFKEFFGI